MVGGMGTVPSGVAWLSSRAFQKTRQNGGASSRCLITVARSPAGVVIEDHFHHPCPSFRRAPFSHLFPPANRIRIRVPPSPPSLAASVLSLFRARADLMMLSLSPRHPGERRRKKEAKEGPERTFRPSLPQGRRAPSCLPTPSLLSHPSLPCPSQTTTPRAPKAQSRSREWAHSAL